MLLLRIASLVPTYILEDIKTNDVFQVFHYVGYFTEGAVDVVGYLQIPTFFLLSGFCLSLGSFLNFSFDHPFCCKGYGSASKSWRVSDFYLARLSRLYPIYLTANIIALTSFKLSSVPILR